MRAVIFKLRPEAEKNQPPTWERRDIDPTADMPPGGLNPIPVDDAAAAEATAEPLAVRHPDRLMR
jgi:hypothetical protein